jgi:hypothetical protein
MKLIPLTQNKFAQVDDEDFEWLSKFKWCAHKIKSHKSIRWYAVRSITQQTIQMHRLILNITDPSIEVDHEDHDGLNNQRYNIRAKNGSFNSYQKAKIRKETAKSKYKGVTYTDEKKRRKKWRARSGSFWIGRFFTEIKAARAYDAKTIELIGLEDAKIGLVLNFPNEH